LLRGSGEHISLQFARLAIESLEEGKPNAEAIRKAKLMLPDRIRILKKALAGASQPPKNPVAVQSKAIARIAEGMEKRRQRLRDDIRRYQAFLAEIGRLEGSKEKQ